MCRRCAGGVCKRRVTDACKRCARGVYDACQKVAPVLYRAQVVTLAGVPSIAGFVDGDGASAKFNQPTGVLGRGD